MGLLCGICGKRPDGYGDDCCNKGAGSKFLMLYVSYTLKVRFISLNFIWSKCSVWLSSGVGLMFLLGIVLIAMTLVYFLVGVVAQRAVCDPLKYYFSHD